MDMEFNSMFSDNMRVKSRNFEIREVSDQFIRQIENPIEE